MHEIVNVRHIERYTLEIEFEDGKKKIIDFTKFLYGEVFEPLKDIDKFASFHIDKELGTIVWDSGADFCPDALYNL